ncbi:tetratricopeptide repeat protein [Tautonia plasticadhaerens]|uniref:Tol-pal system protein YbgF n=1 Tax=Tautonia plasticadhaerens TaxID=2527974 RepID=A0A518HBL9_9BACT|nr:tetratricopeptide repeat protein [Tautonia plasticadhaerens]QDV38253.1 tol-pal system protein YbgF [Tautonia plasticadhaerens]
MRDRPQSPGRLHASVTPFVVLLLGLGTVFVPEAGGQASGTGVDAGAVPEALNFANGLFRARRFDLAVREYRRFLESGPGGTHRADALYGLANAHQFLQEYDRARSAFEEFLRVAPAGHPNAATALFRVGELAYVLGDLPAARRALESYTAGPPAHRYQELAWPYLGDVRFREGDLDGAREAYEHALSAFPDGRLADRSRLYLGRALAKQGDREGALARFRELIDRPDAAQRDEAYYQVGRLELEAGAFDRAVEAFEALEREVPQSAFAPRARLGRAEALTSLERFEEAAEAIEPLRDDPSPEISARAAYLLGLGQLEQGKAAEALATFDEALARSSESSTAPALLFRSAEASASLGDPLDALSRFERLADSYPADSWADDALLQASSIALKAGEPDRATELARRARGPSGDGPLAAPALLVEGRAALESGEVDEAIGLLETLLDQHQPDPETAQAARYSLGLAYKGAGKDAEAIEQLDLLAGTPGASLSADALYLVGQAHFDEGRYAEAAEALGRFIEARPDGEAVDHALARIALARSELGEDDQALDALDRLAARFPESPVLGPTRLRLAEAALDGEHWGRAEGLFRAVAEAEGVDPASRARALSGMGWALTGAGAPEEAAEAFGTLVGESPEDPLAAEASYVRGTALRELGRPEEAIEALAWVVEHHPDSDQAPKADLAKARLLAELGRPGEAAPLLRALVDRGEDEEAVGEPVDRLLAELGWALIDAGDPDGADLAFSRLLDESPNSPLAGDARLNLAESAFQAGEYDEVLDRLGPMVAEGADVAPRLRQAALYREGRTRVERQEWDEAIGAFDRLVAEFPEGRYAREAAFWAAEVAFRRGDAEGAESRFSALVDATPEDREPESWLATARLRRIQALVQLGRWADVLDRADAMKAEFPEFPQIAELEYARGRALQGQAPPRFEDARAAYQAVIDARKGGELAAMSQFMRGETYFHEKDYEEALREFLKVDVLPSYDDAPKWQALALLEAGKVYEQLDRWADAADLYERLRARFPDEPASLEADRRLTIARSRASGGSGPRTGRRG